MIYFEDKAMALLEFVDLDDQKVHLTGKVTELEHLLKDKELDQREHLEDMASLLVPLREGEVTDQQLVLEDRDL